MKQRLAKAIAVVSALASIIVVAAGCGTDKKPVDTSVTSNTESQSTPNSKLDKTVKLRVAVLDHTEAGAFEPGATTENNQFLNAIKEKTGYANLEWDLLAGASFQNTLKLSIASDDAYDLMLNAEWKSLSKQGVLMELTDLLKEYGGKITASVPASAMEAATVNGKLYCIPSPMHTYYKDNYMGGGLLVRQDILDKLNLTAPKTPDELYTFLKKIKEAGYVPYVTGSSGQTPISGLEVMTTAFGCGTGNFVVRDGQLVDMREQPEFKECLTFLNKLYSEQLIDNEYLYNTTQKATEKITSGRAACTFAACWDMYNDQNALAKTDPNAKLAFVAPIKGANGYTGYSQGAPLGNTMSIPNNAKYPKQAVDLANTYFGDKDLQKYIVYGQEGRDYSMDANGNMTTTDNYKTVMYKLNYRLITPPELWGSLGKLAGYGPAMDSYVSSGPHCSAFNIENYMPTSKSQAEYGTAQADLFNEYIAKIITGALPVSALSDYLKAADASGRKEILKENQEWFNQYGKDIYNKLNAKS